MTAGKNFKRAQDYYNHYKSFRQVFDVSVSTAQRQFFVIAHIFEIMQFDNMLQKCFNYSYGGSTSLPTSIIEPSTYWAFTCSKSATETLEQAVKSIQS